MYDDFKKYIEHVKVYFNGFKYKQELDLANAKLEKLTKKLDEDGYTELWEMEEDKVTLVHTLRAVKSKIKKEEAKLYILHKEVGLYEDCQRLETAIKLKQGELLSLEKLIGKNKEIKDLDTTIQGLKNNVEALKSKTIYWESVLDDENNGVFVRPEDLQESTYYKAEIAKNKERQREMKKNGTATHAKEWTVEGSVKEGKKFTKSNVDQILRGFDGESNVNLKMLTLTNYNQRCKALEKSYNQLNKINKPVGVEIQEGYYLLKRGELDLAYKELVKKEEEKEILREEREREKEEKLALKEIEKEKKKVDKDINHYDIMMEELRQQIANLQDENAKIELEKEVKDLESKKADKEAEKEDLDLRESKATAGYVYIISNIGSFGKDMVKIGVTRRIDPYERIKELSSASVPFKFDVHAMIFSEEAYKLETELHNKFRDKRVNLVNNRKEFFYVNIDELKEELEAYKNVTLNFDEEPDAKEFKESNKIRNDVKKNRD